MSENELNTAARDLLAVRAMIEELQAEAEALTDKIKGAMVDRGQVISLGIVEALGAILDNPTRYAALQEAVKEGSEK